MATDVKNYVLGRGELFFAPFLTGTTNPGGERYLGNTTEFNLTIDSDKLDHFSSDEGIKTKDDSALLELNRSATLTTDNISDENMALFILGDVSLFSQAATPVVDENLGACEPDLYYQLGRSNSNPLGVRNVSAVTLEYQAGTPVTLVEGTDYTIELDTGRVYFIEGGQVDGAQDVHVDYTPAAENRKNITTNSAASVDGALRFVSKNAKGKQKDVYIPYVTLAPAGDLALKGDDWQNMAFDVEVGSVPGLEAIYVGGRAV